DLFNARNYFATKNSTLKRNQFGGTIGGPAIKNRLFFFGGYQGTIVRQDPSDNKAFVPAGIYGPFSDWPFRIALSRMTRPRCSSPHARRLLRRVRFSPPGRFKSSLLHSRLFQFTVQLVPDSLERRLSLLTIARPGGVRTEVRLLECFVRISSRFVQTFCLGD